MSKIERTFFIVKPDGEQITSRLLSIFEMSGFTLKSAKSISDKELIKSNLKKHYAHIVDKPFYKDVEDYMLSGNLLVGILYKENAIADLRELLGSTNPLEARPGTIRHKFGSNIDGKIKNVVHGSDSSESAEREISIWLEKEKL